MALELTLDKTNKSKKIDVKTPVSKLVFELITQQDIQDGVTFPSSAQEPMEDMILNFLSKLGDIEVIKYHENGSKTLINTMPISILAQLGAQNEGYININKRTVDGNLCNVATFTVELSNFGAISANQNEFIGINVTSFNPRIDSALTNQDAAFEDAIMQIYTFGAPAITNAHIVYKPVACQAEGETRINVEEASHICVPLDDLKNLEINYTSGETQKLTKKELELIQSDINEIQALLHNTVINKLNYIVYPIPTGERLSVTLTASKNCYLLINEVI